MFAGITKTQPRDVLPRESVPYPTRQAISRALHPECPDAQKDWVKEKHELEIVRFKDQRFVVDPSVPISFVKKVYKEICWHRSIFIDKSRQIYRL